MQRRGSIRRSGWWAGAAAVLLSAAACGPTGPEVVVYCALDQEHSEALLEEFEKETGIRVKARFDNEITKTVGLRKRIQTERDNPRCDVFWNNEIVNTILLKIDGLTEEYRSPSAEEIPAGFKDPEGHWTGFAARARIFIVNTEKCPPEERPDSCADYLDPARKGKWCIARPLLGTTATHAAVLFDLNGEEAAKAWFQGALDNSVAVLSSNGHTMRQVRVGQFPYGLTDTDDFNVAKLDGYPVGAIYPDQGEDQPGCLVIPNTVCMIKGGPNPDHARRFIDWVLSKKVEERLAFARSAQIPLRDDVPCPDNVRRLSDLKVMPADFNRAAERFEEVAAWLRESFVN